MRRNVIQGGTCPGDGRRTFTFPVAFSKPFCAQVLKVTNTISTSRDYLSTGAVGDGLQKSELELFTDGTSAYVLVIGI